MPDSTSPTAKSVVTLRTVLGNDGVESPRTENPASEADRQTLDRYERVVQLMTEETAQAGENVFITVQDRDASLLQSRIAELQRQAAENGAPGEPLAPGGVEAKFGEGLTGGDILGWLRSVFDHVSRDRWHPITRPPDSRTERLADDGRVAVLSDWGTNLYGAPVSAASIQRTGGYEMLMHLGDVYYSGTKTEMQERFLQVWPSAAAKANRALNGNHEMYSGGDAYFDEVLPFFGQRSSYFAAQNAHWVLAGLDTAHTDHDVDADQVAWLRGVMQGAGERKLVLFSHHQPFSRFDTQGPKLQSALRDLLASKAITAWYWGHEHDCILYDRHPRFGLLGRCIGHGGIPSPRKSAVKDAPTDTSVSGVAWKRLGATADSPGCLVLDGPNPLVPGEERKFGPHGYLTLDFAGPRLVERVHLPDGAEIWRGDVA